VIGRRAHANLIGETVVCTPCYRKHQKAETAKVKAAERAAKPPATPRARRRPAAGPRARRQTPAPITPAPVTPLAA
jgi:hypothetical protein